MAELTLTGNLGSDSELTFTPQGKAKLEFSVGDTPRRLNPQSQQWEDAGETTWWRVTLWEEEAEAYAEQLVKGARVYIVGNAGVRTFEKKDGSKGFSAEVKPKHVFVIPKKGAPRQNPRPTAQQSDPWAAPAASNAGGWSTGPGADVPF